MLKGNESNDQAKRYIWSRAQHIEAGTFDSYTQMEQALKQYINSSSDGQKPTTNIKSEIDDKKSYDQTHQIIRLVATKASVDDLLQDQQQELLQVHQIKSSDNTIKIVDIYEMEEKIKQRDQGRLTFSYEISEISEVFRKSR